MRYTNKDALLNDIAKEHAALSARLRQIPISRWHAPGLWGDQWTLTDLVAHLAAWHDLFLTWFDQGRNGAIPAMPAPGYKWNQTPQLNRAIREQFRTQTPAAAQAHFHSTYARILQIIQPLSQDQLLQPGHFPWTGKNPLATYLGPNTASHYRFAQKVIKRWLTPPAPPSAKSPTRPAKKPANSR